MGKSTTSAYDAFISYNTADSHFAAKLERALEYYNPPKNLQYNRQRLNIFCNQADWTGADYHQAIVQRMRESRKLIVICSLRAGDSESVNRSTDCRCATGRAGR